MVYAGKKRNKELMEFKQELAKKEPIKSDRLYEEYHYRDVYKRINTQMESFFYERPYTLDNFNFLLNLVAEQAQPDAGKRIEEIVHKMGIMGIKPDDKSYNYMIKASGNIKDVAQAEKYFKEACLSNHHAI